ncbi:MAG: hypothetical protein BGO70_14350 [Bacteroidetes bacterium 43-93]|uniref:restriction endonuclease n=1 Tax=uncultured Dysgonomonas sp. TaxID=206096 RepID=UPI0009270E53|nr:restriction endonuclease [uncultured Dysgonomonas sp.]MBN9485524.1 restriction endonuclease [Bacteroidota bacterium]OJW99606.1 MAG: hypothetical protein BGO70_14350 [Bacteroidetes bacterium 43-93]
MPKTTIKEAIIAVLTRVGKPLSIKEIYAKIIEWDYYRFRAERPEGIVAVEIRRHAKGVEFPTAHPNKYYQIQPDGRFWLLDESIEPDVPVNTNPTNGIIHPISETIKRQHQQYIAEFKLQIISQLKEIDPQTFEAFSKKLLEVYGFKDMQVTQYSKDGGIDGYGKLKVGITHLNVAFQSKRWKQNTVSKKEIQSFRGDIQGKFEQGIYFTTSIFSKDAKTVSIQKGAVPIILIDGATIIDIMVDKKFGIEVENLPIYVNALDRALTEEL